jgi:hypothetical protein
MSLFLWLALVGLSWAGLYAVSFGVGGDMLITLVAIGIFVGLSAFAVRSGKPTEMDGSHERS